MKAYEISVKYRTKKKDLVTITSSGDSDKTLRTWFVDCMEHRERFVAMFLNRANKVVGIQNVGEGGTSSCVVDVKVIAQGAILSNASAVILAHNHPSGQLKPSESDKKITQKVKAGLGLFDIKILDHLILTSLSYYSFADEMAL